MAKKRKATATKAKKAKARNTKTSAKKKRTAVKTRRKIAAPKRIKSVAPKQAKSGGKKPAADATATLAEKPSESFSHNVAGGFKAVLDTLVDAEQLHHRLDPDPAGDPDPE